MPYFDQNTSTHTSARLGQELHSEWTGREETFKCAADFVEASQQRDVGHLIVQNEDEQRSS